MGKGLFVVGTGTDIGKTYVTALLVKELKKAGKEVGYYKAAVSGNSRDDLGKLIPGDALFVKNMSGLDQTTDEMCSYVYERAVSPHLAAKLEGNPVELDVVKMDYENVADKFDYVFVEGSGGILCPLRFDSQKIWLEDVIKTLSLPTVIVADAGLGTINSVVLTYEYMKSKNIPVKGIIFNNYHPGNVMEEDNIVMCEYMTKKAVIATVEAGAQNIQLRQNKEKLMELFD